MAYQINRYNQSLLTTVEDGTIDQSTDLKFVGRNYAGYGEIQNENFLYLLENFANNTPPTKRIKGQIWFDSTANKLKFFDGLIWRTAGGAEISADRPNNLTEGDFWWDSDNKQLFAFDGSDFILIGPQDVGEGITGMQERTLLDTTGSPHRVIASVVEGVIVHLISETEFDIQQTANNSIPGFSRVKKGLTLIDTPSTGVTTTDHYFWGTASSALGLVQNGSFVNANDFVTQGSATFNTRAEFGDLGYVLGDSGDLRVYVPFGTDNKIAFENQIGNSIFFGVKDEFSVSNSLRITADNILPGVEDITANEKNYIDRSIDIGSSDNNFNTVYANTFEGTSTVCLTVRDRDRGENRSLSINPIENTIALRDSTGDLRANLFVGTALSAKYADLAEKYTSQRLLEIGTIVSVCNHEGHEICPAKEGDVVAGVISEKPAFLMNTESKGQPVALAGRVPVLVKGPVNKGQMIYAQDGYASIKKNNSCVGIALQSKDSDVKTLVEVMLKV